MGDDGENGSSRGVMTKTGHRCVFFKILRDFYILTNTFIIARTYLRRKGPGKGVTAKTGPISVQMTRNTSFGPLELVWMWCVYACEGMWCLQMHILPVEFEI
jgi:hypothetical protein